MEPLTIAILLLVAGVALIIAEVLLPAGGVIGVLGVGGILASIVMFFTINTWLGIGVFAAAVLLSPFAGYWLVELWRHSPIGRALIVEQNVGKIAAVRVEPGQTGTTVSTLRPMGEVDFAGLTVEAISEYGDIPAGRAVEAVGYSQNIVRVRPAPDARDTATA
ncbi:MAG: hypothetical protein ACFCVE_12310 [Phycisphaerae bacterium]